MEDETAEQVVLECNTLSRGRLRTLAKQGSEEKNIRGDCAGMHDSRSCSTSPKGREPYADGYRARLRW